MTVDLNQIEIELNVKLEKIKARRNFELQDALADIEREIDEKLNQYTVDKRRRISKLIQNATDALNGYESTTDIESKFAAVCRAHYAVDDLYWFIDGPRQKVFIIRKELLKEKIAIQPFARKIRDEHNH